MAVNRDIFLRSLALQLVFFLVTVQGTRLGDATVAANALLLNGLLLTAHALDGLAHAVEALSGHAIGAGDRNALQRVMVVAGVGHCWPASPSACSFCSAASCSSSCRPTYPRCARPLTYLPIWRHCR